MPRKPRKVIPNMPHHVVQRGNRRQSVFFCDDDRELYLDLMRHYTRKFNTYVLGYCLMDNHVHHMLVPADIYGLRRVLQPLHMHYAQIINQRMGWNGHLWQERFYSAAVKTEYFWIAMRYVERNPVAAGIVSHSSEYAWSSAAAHCGLKYDPALFCSNEWNNELDKIKNWHSWLEQADIEEQVNKIKQATRRDQSCGFN